MNEEPLAQHSSLPNVRDTPEAIYRGSVPNTSDHGKQRPGRVTQAKSRIIRKSRRLPYI